MKLKIEAVTVCAFHSKYLEMCMPNRHQFDRWLIVTVPNDYDTINICKKYGIEYTFTNRLLMEHGLFVKSDAINDGLDRLGRDGWMVHIDSDILLPPNFREFVEADVIKHETYNSPKLYEDKLYAINRQIVEDPAHFNFDEFWDVLKKWDVRGRGAYRGDGYFQMFHSYPFSMHTRDLPVRYPRLSLNAGYDDVFFTKLFEEVVPLDLTCIHLGPIGQWSYGLLDLQKQGLRPVN